MVYSKLEGEVPSGLGFEANSEGQEDASEPSSIVTGSTLSPDPERSSLHGLRGSNHSSSTR